MCSLIQGSLLDVVVHRANVCHHLNHQHSGGFALQKTVWVRCAGDVNGGGVYMKEA